MTKKKKVRLCSLRILIGGRNIYISVYDYLLISV